MGLDMYLTREVYFPNFAEPFPATEIPEPLPFGIERDRIEIVTERMGYWRKANAIHGWFVRECADGEDECQRIYVSLEKLRKLRDTVQKVLDYRDAHPGEDVEGYAMGMLPPTEGFFFGAYDIDDWYWEDLENTIEILDRAIPIAEEDATRKPVWCSMYYRASW